MAIVILDLINTEKQKEYMIQLRELTEDEFDFYKERVKIMQYDGGLTEKEAHDETLKRIEVRRNKDKVEQRNIPF